MPSDLEARARAPMGNAEMISTFLLLGPPPPGPPVLWQATQEVSLYTGPSPSPPWLRESPGIHSRRNNSRPSASFSPDGLAALAAAHQPPTTAKTPRQSKIILVRWACNETSPALMARSSLGLNPGV